MRQKLYVCSILAILLLSNMFIVAQNETIGEIQCGDIVEGEVVAEQSQMGESSSGYRITFDAYDIGVQAGTRINLSVTPLGNTFNVAITLLDSGGNDVVMQNNGADGESEDIFDFPLASANQVLRIMGASPGIVEENYIYSRFYGNGISWAHSGNYFGAYEVRMGCVLRDGTIIEPGDNPDETSSDTPLPGKDDEPIPSNFSGFGFPGLGSVDFSAGIELPLTLSQPQLAPVAGDLVALYTYDASDGQVATLSLSRSSGDISIGVAVINKETNEILFLGGMPSSDNLSVELTFPSAGTYAIGLFQLMTIEHPETSGAVQITLQ